MKSDPKSAWLSDLQTEILDKALELGMGAVGFASVSGPTTGERYLEWLQSGMHAELSYLERGAQKRMDPTLILPGARSMIVVLVNYGHSSGKTEVNPEITAKPVLARYSRYLDYHDTMGARLKELAEFVDQRYSEAASVHPGEKLQLSSKSLWYVDTGPILEREYASRAGLGFVGKHTGLISREFGNWTFIGEIITQIPFQTRFVQEPNRCGKCTRCLDVCPTNAFPEPFQLDARKCISYWTIENKGSIPLEMREKIGNRLFGCDDCLAVCPWNRFAQQSSWMKEFIWAPEAVSENLVVEWLNIQPSEFKQTFKNTPIMRSKRKGFLRNLCVVAGNLKLGKAKPVLMKLAEDPEPLIAEHAQWAIQKLEQARNQISNP